MFAKLSAQCRILRGAATEAGYEAAVRPGRLFPEPSRARLQATFGWLYSLLMHSIWIQLGFVVHNRG
jgi:hypothetical protein